MAPQAARWGGGVILGLYLSRMYAVRFLGALAGFVALIEILDLFDMAGEILDRGEGVRGVLYYAALRLPVIAVDAAPFAALVGALFTFMALAGKSEATAMRSVGMPARRIVLLLAPIALLAGALHVAASATVAPPAESAVRDWMLRTADPETPGQAARYWLRSGDVLVGFAAAAPDGAQLDRIWIYERDPEGRFLRRIIAESATHDGNLWRLETASANGPDGTRETLDEMMVDLALGPADVLELSQPLEHLSLRRLQEGASGGPSGARSQAFFQTRLLTMMSFLVIPAVMLVIAAPVAFASARRRKVGLQAAYGLGLGLSFILIAGILRTVAEAGVMPPFAAVWAAPLAFALFGAARLAEVER